MDNWNRWNIRVVLLGDAMVGKSTLVLRAAGRPLETPLAPTIGIDYDRAHVEVEGEHFSLQLWDTAGQERFRSIVDGYFRGAACLLLCVASDSIESLKGVQEHWYPTGQGHNPQAVYAVVLTKMDAGNGQVEELTRAWAAERGLPVFPTHGLHQRNQGVEPLLQWVAATCRTTMPPAGMSRPLAATAAPPPTPPTDLPCCRLM